MFYTTHLTPVSALFFRNLYGPATERVGIVWFYLMSLSSPYAGSQCRDLSFHAGEYPFDLVHPRQRYEIYNLDISWTHLM